MDQRSHFTGVFIHGGTRKSAYSLNIIRKTCIYFGGFQKTVTLDSEILYFEGPNTDQFQSRGHSYCLKRAVTMC